MKDNNIIKADLHLHSTASDGRLTPYQLVELAEKSGIKIISITDHDTVDGISQALEATKIFSDISFIPGVEINTDVPGTEVHMLGYFINFESQRLLSSLAELRSSRETRALQMLDRLNNLGMHLEWEDLKSLAKDGPIGRPHVAIALLNAGYISSYNEAFDKYIGRNGPAYVEHKKMTPIEVIKLIKEVNGIPVLAHPDNIYNLHILLPELVKSGLIGIEVYYDNYSSEVINRLCKVADEYNLIKTGGSDYHALNGENETMIGCAQIIPRKSIEELYVLAEKFNPDLIRKFGLYLKI